MIKNYLKKFSLKRKKAFVIGGSGLIGSEIVEALLSASATVINLDKKEPNKLYKNIKKRYHYNYFEITNLDLVDKEISRIFKKFGCPDIFINCSYPATKY